MAVIPKITNDQVEAALGFEVKSFKQNAAVESATYIQYDVTVVPVDPSTSMVKYGDNYIIQINIDGGEESV